MSVDRNKLIQILQNKGERIELCRRSLFFFALYYFSHYYTHNSPDFHKELCRDLDELREDKYKYLVVCGFRGSGKTSFAKMDFIHNIVYGAKNMMLFVSFDEETSRNNLFDISLELQTNQKIINDFGQLYYDDSNVKKSKKHSIGNFLTANGVRVQASSVKKTLRGQMFQGYRPDAIYLDDFENNDTKRSAVKTRRTIEYIDEMLGGLAQSSSVVFCCNKISDNGSVAHLYDKFENNPEGRVFEKAVIENDEIVWDSKFVHTDKEALEKNSVLKKSAYVVSLEGLRRTMNSDGRAVFEQEMLNMPLVDGERLFNTKIVDKEIERVKAIKFNEDGIWKIWTPVEQLAKYIIAIDVSEGFGLDSSVIQVLNVDTGEQAAEFEDNLTPPEQLVKEIIDAHNNFNKALIVPERNGIGSSVVALLKEKGLSMHMPVETKIDTIKNVKVNKYGWQTNGTNKPKMLFDFKRDFENGDLIINSLPLLREMRAFSNYEIEYKRFNQDDTISNHFDRVMAMAIANQMKNKNVGDFRVSQKGQSFPLTAVKAGRAV